MTNKILILSIIFAVICSSVSGKKSAIHYFNTTEKNVNDICFSKNGFLLAVPDGKTIKIFDTASQDLKCEFTDGHTDRILTLKISNDSTLLLSAGKDSTIVIWDFISRKIKEKLSYHKAIITTIDISHDKKYLASASTEGKVIIYDLNAKKIVGTWSKNSCEITSVKFSPDNKLLALAGSDSYIYLYDINTARLIQTLNGHKGWIRELVFSDNGNELTSCGDDSRLINWNISKLPDFEVTNKKRRSFGWLLSVDRYDVNCYATGDMDGKVKIIVNSAVYTKNIGAPVNKILFKQNQNEFLTVAVATQGKGVVIIEAKDMNIK